MSYIFGRKLREHAQAQWKRLSPWSRVTGPRTQWMTAQSEQASVNTVEVLRRTGEVEGGVKGAIIEEGAEKGVEGVMNTGVQKGKAPQSWSLGLETRAEGSDPDIIRAISEE